MFQRVALVAGALLLLCQSPSCGQDGIAGQLYGSGVHAFFGGDFQQAHKLLTESIDAGSRDPRTYYFRGLAYSKLGREEEAELDFAKGSELETAEVDRLQSISKSLERVQGADRLKIEKHRTKARVAAYQKAEELRKARYEQLRREEDRVLEQQSQAAPGPAGKGLPVAPNVTFGEPAGREPAAKPGTGAEPAPDAEAKPEAGGMAPAAEQPGGDAKKAAAPGAANPETAGGADPFAPSPVEEKKATGKKAVAEEGEEGGASKKKASAKKKAAADDADPFAAPADEKKAGTKKKAAADDADPFAAPAEKKK